MADTMDLVMPAGNGVLAPAELAAQERRKRAFLQGMTKVADIAKATAHVHTGEFTVPVLVLGTSKVSDEGHSKMIYVMFPDFRKFTSIVKNIPTLDADGAISVVVDARQKSTRERDEKSALDLSKEPVYSKDDVDGKVDANESIRRIRVKFEPNSFESFRNDAKLTLWKTGLFAVVNIEASAWHDEDTKRIAVSPKITGHVYSVEIPPGIFTDWAYDAGFPTKTFKTLVKDYANFMAKNPQLKPDNEKDKKEIAPFRYRNDNQFIIPIGFEDRLAELLMQDRGCHLRDITDTSKEQSLVDTRKNLNRYLANFHGRQWRTTAKGERVTMDFTVDVAFFDDVIGRLGISSLATWKALFPVVRSQFKALVFGCEDADRTFQSKLVRERINLSEDVNFLNQPNGNSPSFALGVTVRSVIFDAVKFYQTIGILVRPETIREFFWNGENRPPSVPAGVKPLAKCDSRVVCLSEIADERREFTDANWELRLVVNIGCSNKDAAPQPLSTLGALSLEEGDCLARFLASCVLAGQGANMTKAEYLETMGDTNPEEREKIGADSVLHRYIFSPPAVTPVAYVVAIHRKRIDEEMADFAKSIKRIGMESVFARTKPGQNALPAPEGASAGPKIELVKSPERAKSPERGTKRAAPDSDAINNNGPAKKPKTAPEEHDIVGGQEEHEEEEEEEEEHEHD